MSLITISEFKAFEDEIPIIEMDKPLVVNLAILPGKSMDISFLATEKSTIKQLQ